MSSSSWQASPCGSGSMVSFGSTSDLVYDPAAPVTPPARDDSPDFDSPAKRRRLRHVAVTKRLWRRTRWTGLQGDEDAGGLLAIADAEVGAIPDPLACSVSSGTDEDPSCSGGAQFGFDNAADAASAAATAWSICASCYAEFSSGEQWWGAPSYPAQQWAPAVLSSESAVPADEADVDASVTVASCLRQAFHRWKSTVWALLRMRLWRWPLAIRQV